ncbi:hypothetical protein WICPIJ_000693 [Wickerhamomyces pijperi]|uniref:Uncharacterized protein n=1 Tax=Wickerhamomyces pijperi TaxID=599730 RepID=A0A9P8QCB6_WICPI|nr:hypothetical protein WICPIJ_000693 [Wickerhamomyces pijperi]
MSMDRAGGGEITVAGMSSMFGISISTIGVWTREAAACAAEVWLIPPALEPAPPSGPTSKLNSSAPFVSSMCRFSTLMWFSTMYSFELSESKSHFTSISSPFSSSASASSSKFISCDMLCLWPFLSLHTKYLETTSLSKLVGEVLWNLTNLLLSSSSALSLSSAFSSRHSATISFNKLEYSLPSNLAGLDFVIICIALIASISQYGGFPVAIS